MIDNSIKMFSDLLIMYKIFNFDNDIKIITYSLLHDSM